MQKLSKLFCQICAGKNTPQTGHARHIVYIDRYTVLDKNKPNKLRLILLGFIIRLELSLSF